MLYRAIRRFNVLKALFGRETFHWVENPIATEFHGSSYGGWAIAKRSLNENSIVYSMGIGEDASFDQSLIDRYQLKVRAYDPTPMSVDWVRTNMGSSAFLFQPIAISERNGFLRFYEPDPKSADQVSASVHQTCATSRSYDVPCHTLAEMLKANGHSHCDLLKMDIEGAEYSVLEHICATGLIGQVKQLLVEFHHFLPGIGIERTNASVELLRRHGFRIGWISRTNHEYLFVGPAFAGSIDYALPRSG